MARYVPHITLTADVEGSKVALMVEHINFVKEVKNQPGQCEIVCSGGSVILNSSFAQMVDAIKLFDRDHLRVIEQTE